MPDTTTRPLQCMMRLHASLKAPSMRGSNEQMAAASMAMTVRALCTRALRLSCAAGDKDSAELSFMNTLCKQRGGIDPGDSGARGFPLPFHILILPSCNTCRVFRCGYVGAEARAAAPASRGEPW